MINGQLNEFAAEENLTQVASYFDIVDEAVKTGDTNKRYIVSTNACVAPSAPVPKGSYTSFVISATADNMADLYNSYIVSSMNIKVKANKEIKASTAPGYNSPDIWFGVKDSMELVESYQLLANGMVFYTQSNAIEEAYITSLATPETVKDSDVFSKVKHEDVFNKVDTYRTGALLRTNGGIRTDKEYTLDIPFKIDIRRFLPLSAVKYLPAFAGHIEIRVKFSTAGIVCCPLSLEDFCDNNPININKITTAPTPTPVTNRFVPLGEEFTCWQGITENGAGSTSQPTKLLTIEKQSFSAVDYTVTEAYSNIATFGLDDNLYQGLIQRYSNQALSFPTQTLTFQAMNGGINGNSLELKLTSTPRFVDSIYVLIPETVNHKTCYTNPQIDNMTFSMGGFGLMPDLPISSWGPQYYELASNCMNTNNDLIGFNKDVMHSLTMHPNAPSTGYKSFDATNYFIGYPTSIDSTFQQGQTSATPITYMLKGTVQQDSPYKGRLGTALCGFLKDSVLAIQVRATGPPIVSLDEYDITSPSND